MDAPKRGPSFRNAGRLQELWNALVPTQEIARELGYYSTRNVCRAVRSMRKIGYHFIYRGAGRPKKDGTPNRVYHQKARAGRRPTEAQLAYWATVSALKTEYYAKKREKENHMIEEKLKALSTRPVIEGGTFRCRFCSGRTDDPMGHPSCRESVA